MMCWEEWQQDIEARERRAVPCKPPLNLWSIVKFCAFITLPLWAIVIRDVLIPWWRS